MADDAGAVGGPGRHGGPGMGGGLPGRYQQQHLGSGRREAAELTEARPTTWLGHLVKVMKIKSPEIFPFSLPINESEITDFFLGASLKDEVLKIMSVQKQTPAGQQARFKALIAIRDYYGHVGPGVKCSTEIPTAIRGFPSFLSSLCSEAIAGNKIGQPHTVPCKVTCCCGSELPPKALAFSQPLCPRSS